MGMITQASITFLCSSCGTSETVAFPRYLITRDILMEPMGYLAHYGVTLRTIRMLRRTQKMANFPGRSMQPDWNYGELETIGQLMYIPRRELLRLRNFGKGALAEVSSALDAILEESKKAKVLHEANT